MTSFFGINGLGIIFYDVNVLKVDNNGSCLLHLAVGSVPCLEWILDPELELYLVLEQILCAVS